MNVLKTNLVIALFLTSLLTYGQRKITGRLVDSESQEPIKEGKVLVIGNYGETNVNVLGYFQLSVSSSDTLVIISRGYETSKIAIPEVDNFKISLSKGVSEDVEVIWTIVEEPARFPGGMVEFYEGYVNKNLKFPKDAKRSKVKGRVLIQFEIDQDGSIMDDIKIIQSLSPSCDEEAIRLIKECPPWIPGKQRGKPVKQRMTLPIIFK